MQNGLEHLDTLAIQNSFSTSGRQRTNALRLLGIMLGAAVGSGLIVLLFSLPLKPVSTFHPGLADILLTIVIGLPLVYGVLLAHEGGHLLSGLLVGFRFLFYIVGPLKIAREQGRIRLGLNTHASFFGGVTGTMPEDERDLVRRMRGMIAGGPLASLALALLSAGLSFVVGFTTHALAALILFSFGLLSFGIFLATAFPTHKGGLYSDGARFLMLLKGGFEAERYCAIIVLNQQFMAGQLPRVWNPALIQQATSHPDNSPDDVIACSLAYYHALDTGAIAEARSYLARMLAGLQVLPSVTRPAFALEAAYFEALYQHNAAAARTWLQQAKGGMVDSCTRLRVEAAVLLAEGKREEAIAKAQEGLIAVKNAIYAGLGRMEEAWLDNLLRDAKSM